jgi:hypothetical protein
LSFTVKQKSNIEKTKKSSYLGGGYCGGGYGYSGGITTSIKNLTKKLKQRSTQKYSLYSGKIITLTT